MLITLPWSKLGDNHCYIHESHTHIYIYILLIYNAQHTSVSDYSSHSNIMLLCMIISEASHFNFMLHLELPVNNLHFCVKPCQAIILHFVYYHFGIRDSPETDGT